MPAPTAPASRDRIGTPRSSPSPPSGRASYDKAPSLDAFKGSGALEYDADCCLLLRLAAANEEEAKALLAKGASRLLVELHVLGKNRYGRCRAPTPSCWTSTAGTVRSASTDSRRTGLQPVGANGAVPRPSPPPLFPPK